MRQKPVLVDTNQYCIRTYLDGKYLHRSYGDYDNLQLAWEVELEKAELFDRESALGVIRQLPAWSVCGIVVRRILSTGVDVLK